MQLASSTVLGLVSLLMSGATALKIATSLQWLEYTPQRYAVQNFYKTDTAQIVSGGVASLATDSSIDVAANAETQGLKAYARSKNIKLIYIIVEVGYRIVANKAKGISSPTDLKGKKIGTMAGTSAQVFISTLLNSYGVKDSDYTVVNGNVCMKNPCGAGTFPTMIKNGQIDAFGIWEPAPELGGQALGNNAIFFQNATTYREVYSLYATDAKLKNADSRKKIVDFLKALNQTIAVYKNTPDKVYAFAAQQVGMDVPTTQAVWQDHSWGGKLDDVLLEYLVKEDDYLSRVDRRTKTSRADLQKFIDTSVMKDAGLM